MVAVDGRLVVVAVDGRRRFEVVTVDGRLVVVTVDGRHCRRFEVVVVNVRLVVVGVDVRSVVVVVNVRLVMIFVRVGLVMVVVDVRLVVVVVVVLAVVIGRVVVLVVVSRVQMMRHRGRMMRLADLLDDRLETVFRVGRVLDQPDRTVRLDQAVVAAHRVPVPFLVLLLYVARVRVVDAVLETVCRIRLRCWRINKQTNKQMEKWNKIASRA